MKRSVKQRICLRTDCRLHWRESSATTLSAPRALWENQRSMFPTTSPVFYEWGRGCQTCTTILYYQSRQEDLEITQDTQNPNALATYAETITVWRTQHNKSICTLGPMYVSGKHVSDGRYILKVVDRQICYAIIGCARCHANLSGHVSQGY